MTISCIFELVNESLYSVHYDNESENEFRRLFECWTDAEYLEMFFEENKADLQSDFWGNISIEEAILRTRQEALELEKELIEIAELGKSDRYNTLSSLFKPLHDSTTRIDDFEENKVKGENKPSWLRIYAIRIDSNLFVISGGAIKLTRTMNERTHLVGELDKLQITKDFLTDEENSDLPIFELFF